MNIKEIMKKFGITDKELLEDIKKQMSYTYDHMVSYKGYTIAQDKNTEFNDVIILKGSKELLHASCNKQFSDEELKKWLVDFVEGRE